MIAGELLTAREGELATSLTFSDFWLRDWTGTIGTTGGTFGTDVSLKRFERSEAVERLERLERAAALRGLERLNPSIGLRAGYLERLERDPFW